MDTALLDVANIFLFVSGFMMLHTAYKDRNILKGYNLSGTIIIALAISLFLAYYIQQGYWLSFALTLPNYCYWLIVAVYVTRNRIGK